MSDEFGKQISSHAECLQMTQQTQTHIKNNISQLKRKFNQFLSLKENKVKLIKVSFAMKVNNTQSIILQDNWQQKQL